MRLAPSCRASIVIAVIRATGTPRFSISFAITAPLRVSDPQVATSTAASMRWLRMSAAISAPSVCIAEIDAFTPVVP